MTGFDAIILALIIVSIFFAAVRGGLKELTTLISLGLAALTAYLLAEPAAGIAGGGAIALIGAALGIAAVSFVGFQVITSILVSRIHLPPGARLADRIGGGVFGLARALVLIGLGFLGYAYYLDEEHRPAAVNDAMFLPLAKGSASFIESFAPARASLEKVDASADASDNATSETDSGASLKDDYDRSARSGLDELVTTVTTSSEDNTAETIAVSAVAAEAGAASGDPVAALINEADTAN